MEEINEITKMIESLKRIISNESYITIPPFRQASRLKLESDDYSFLLDLNRKGHKRPKCTFQLRENRMKDRPLVRVDIIGSPHHNPKGDFRWSDTDIPCPHLHRADFPKYGNHVAVPLLEDNGNFTLSKSDLVNLGVCLKKALIFLNVKNISDYKILEQ